MIEQLYGCGINHNRLQPPLAKSQLEGDQARLRSGGACHRPFLPVLSPAPDPDHRIITSAPDVVL